jgi:hypothetical protein
MLSALGNCNSRAILPTALRRHTLMCFDDWSSVSKRERCNTHENAGRPRIERTPANEDAITAAVELEPLRGLRDIA